MHSWAWVNLTYLGSNATTTSYDKSLNHNLFKILRKYSGRLLERLMKSHCIKASTTRIIQI